MTIEEMKRTIQILRNKKEKALSDLQTYRNGKTDVKAENYIEYEGLTGTLVTGIGKQRPLYVEQYKEIKEQISYTTRQKKLEKLEALVNVIETEIDNGLIKGDDIPDSDISSYEKNIENIFEKFHSCCRQARSRYDKRPTIDVKDEYDVQDLIHILLRLHFSDVRKEEYTPSYAGGSSRMDFLLKDIQTVIEVKKTRDTLKAKEIGEELIIDIAKYKTHPDCKKLYCFVYDPEGLIANPKSLESDLSGNKDGLSVQVSIRPKE